MTDRCRSKHFFPSLQRVVPTHLITKRIFIQAQICRSCITYPTLCSILTVASVSVGGSLCFILDPVIDATVPLAGPCIRGLEEWLLPVSKDFP